MNTIKSIRIVVTLISVFFALTVVGNNIASSSATLPLSKLKITCSSTSNENGSETASANRQSPESHQTPGLAEIKGRLLQGDTFDSALRRHKVSADIRSLLINSLQSKLDFKHLKPEDCYTITLNEDGKLHSFVYESGPFNVFTIKSTYDGYSVQKDPIELERQRIIVSGEITSSLTASFAASNEDMRLIYTFADIFSSKLDFNTEAQRGDKYTLIFDKYLKNGELVGYGKIQSAHYYRTNGSSYDAYYFSSDKTIGSYFDGEGQGVGASFIRSPLPMGRVSSRFSYHRKHPITGVVKPHLGIDLAAPTGTPIMAAADGMIVSIGRNGGNGRQIIIAHDGDYKTYYGHLSRYRKGLHKGSIVSKKSIIGYVGSSGIATGPHLDYRIKHHGVFKNPFSIEFKPKKILAGNELQGFTDKLDSLNELTPKGLVYNRTQIMQVNNLTLTSARNLVLL